MYSYLFYILHDVRLSFNDDDRLGKSVFKFVHFVNEQGASSSGTGEPPCGLFERCSYIFTVYLKRHENMK